MVQIKLVSTLFCLRGIDSKQTVPPRNVATPALS